MVWLIVYCVAVLLALNLLYPKEQRGFQVQSKKLFFISGMACTALLLLTSCSSGEDLAQVLNEAEDSTQTLSMPIGTLEDETADLVIPEGTNLRINYTDPAYSFVVSAEYILQQWRGMKTCLEVDVPDGYILVEREVIPPAQATDVIQLPDQSFAASATDRQSDVFIQILVDDFDPSLDDRGYFFRQIIGPYMWRYNGLDNRRYDPNCAAFVVR